MEDDVSNRIWAVFGQTVHSLLESEGENDFTEQEMSYQAGDIPVTGRIDNYDMQNGVIGDYKTASAAKVKFGDFNDRRLQGMIYAWLLAKNKFPVTPQGLFKTGAFIRAKVNKYKQCLRLSDGAIPP